MRNARRLRRWTALGLAALAVTGGAGAQEPEEGWAVPDASGRYRLLLTQASVQRARRYQSASRNEAFADGSLTMFLLTPKPVFRVKEVALTGATLDTGGALPEAKAETWTFNEEPTKRSINVGFAPPDPAATRIASLGLAATVLYAAGHDEVRWPAAALAAKTRPAVKKGSAAIALKSVKPGGTPRSPTYQVEVSLKGALPGAPKEENFSGRPWEIFLLDAKGKRHVPNSSFGGGFDDEMEYTFGWEQLPAGFKPAALVLRWVNRVQEEKAEFQFKDIPLP